MTKKKRVQHKVTASDVAASCGVSKWTVQRAFTPGASVSGHARDKIMTAARALGYRPNLLARSLSQKKTNIIGVAIDELKNPHSLMMLDVVTKLLQSRNHMALTLNITPGENYRSVLSMAEQLQVDGILFLGTMLTQELVAVAHDMHHVPLVQVCRHSDVAEIDSVNIDGFKAGGEIANLLLQQGCRRFGYIKGPETKGEHLLRMEGYQHSLFKAGRTLELVLAAGSYNRQFGYQAMDDYLRLAPEEGYVDAFFCANDILALGALDALKQHNKQSAIAIVGFDDIDEASAGSWQLTTYRQGIEHLIGESLNRLIDGQSRPEVEWQKGELIIRRSHLKKV